MYLDDYDIDEAIQKGEEAQRILNSQLYKQWVEGVQGDLLHLLQADNGSKSIEDTVWFLRGAYSFRTHLEMVVKNAERAREQRKSRKHQSTAMNADI